MSFETVEREGRERKKQRTSDCCQLIVDGTTQARLLWQEWSIEWRRPSLSTLLLNNPPFHLGKYEKKSCFIKHYKYLVVTRGLTQEPLLAGTAVYTCTTRLGQWNSWRLQSNDTLDTQLYGLKDHSPSFMVAEGLEKSPFSHCCLSEDKIQWCVRVCVCCSMHVHTYA